MQSIRLPFPVPLHACFTNAGKRGRVKTARYTAYGHTAYVLLLEQRAAKVKGPVSVFVRLVAPDLRPRDADNLGKCLLDTLKVNGIIEDDSNRYVKRLTFEWHPDGPPCLVTVQPIEDIAA